MKRIDKLVIGTFLGLFVLTFCIGSFIILLQLFLFKLEQLIGKGLGWGIYLQLSSYFAVVASKQAFPLAILLASIMAMGNLGEHHELTALKSAGISPLRVLLPLFVFSALLSVLALFSNSYLVPHANLNSFSLLYDLSKKKPSLAIKEGVFYDDIPGYSIKVRKQLEGQNLKGIMIYDHTQKRGNVSLTMAESGKLYTTHNETHLVMELFDGHSYTEGLPQGSDSQASKGEASPFYHSSFKIQKLILSLDSFKLSRTEKEQFENNLKTKSISQLTADTKAMQARIRAIQQALQAKAIGGVTGLGSIESSPPEVAVQTLPEVNFLTFKNYIKQKQQEEEKNVTESPTISSPPRYKATDLETIYSKALDQAKELRYEAALQAREQWQLERKIRGYELEKHQMMAWALACVVIFLVGAPLGAIIKKGGLGIPVLIALSLIVWHYIFEMLGEKWSNAEVVSPFIGAWLANIVLLPFGIFFLIQAYRDARLLEADFYAVLLARMKRQLGKVRGLFRRSTH